MELIGGGRSADVFALDGGLVLRRYRTGLDVAGEAGLMVRLAECGYPVPRVVSAGGTDLVMERLYGPTMLRALMAGELDLPGAARVLADLHRRLHALPGRVVHLDLHPDNVILTAGGPVVIDWCNAARGGADLDVAMTALIIAQEGSAGAVTLMRAFLEHAGGDPAAALEESVTLRARDPNLTQDEIADLPQAAARVRDACPSHGSPAP